MSWFIFVLVVIVFVVAPSLIQMANGQSVMRVKGQLSIVNLKSSIKEYRPSRAFFVCGLITRGSPEPSVRDHPGLSHAVPPGLRIFAGCSRLQCSYPVVLSPRFLLGFRISPQGAEGVDHPPGLFSCGGPFTRGSAPVFDGDITPG